jgi:uncharacterized alpha/beta hydrolase family protein
MTIIIIFAIINIIFVIINNYHPNPTPPTAAQSQEKI